MVAALTAVCASAQLYVGAGYSYSPTASKAGKITERFDRNGFYIRSAKTQHIRKKTSSAP